jgi:hypothetical protein
MIGKKSPNKRPVRKAGKRDGKSTKPKLAGEPLENAADDRRAFTSGFPMDEQIAEEAVKQLFWRLDQTDADLSLLCMEGASFPDWMADPANREVDPLIAMKGVENVSTLIVDRLLRWAETSPESRPGQWAGKYLAEILARLLAASPVRKFELKESAFGILSNNPVFMDRIQRVRGSGVGAKHTELRGSDVRKFVANTWREALTIRDMVDFRNAMAIEVALPVQFSDDEKLIQEVLSNADKQMRERKPDVEVIARVVFSDLLASMLKGRWDSACMEFPAMARAAHGMANRKGMKSSFSAKSDNLRDAWLSIAAGEQGLSRLIS